jgi:hypothetical protein
VTSSRLRTCEQCHQPWPKGPDHDLRGFAWLDPLPRKISVSNADLLVHDGLHGPNRYLFLEAKMPWEPPLQKGQNWLLRSLAEQRNWTVRVLHGRLGSMTMHRVHPTGVDAVGLAISAVEFRASVADWLNGQAWSDPRGRPLPGVRSSHTCGYAKEDGVWRCVQDFYAIGDAPETGCGAVWLPPKTLEASA